MRSFNFVGGYFEAIEFEVRKKNLKKKKTFLLDVIIKLQKYFDFHIHNAVESEGIVSNCRPIVRECSGESFQDTNTPSVKITTEEDHCKISTNEPSTEN